MAKFKHLIVPVNLKYDSRRGFSFDSDEMDIDVLGQCGWEFVSFWKDARLTVKESLPDSYRRDMISEFAVFKKKRKKRRKNNRPMV